MAILFTSDLHLGHENILASRPQFSNLQEMNTYIIEKWNAKVREEDEVYILGDFSYRSEYCASYYLQRMRGYKHLIIGNHDFKWMKNVNVYDYFETVQNMAFLNLDNVSLTLCHYPMMEWPRSRYIENGNSYLIHGHIHGEKESETFKFIKENLPHALNCGVDVNNYEPCAFHELVANNKKFYDRG